VPISSELAAEAEGLIGGRGAAAHVRLGLEADTPPGELADEARRYLLRWRAVAENPLTDRLALDACRVVVRSCEGVLADLFARQRHRQPA
jgi:hypothetical protein